MVELMPDPRRTGLQYEGSDSRDTRLLKHVRRADLFRLLKHLGHKVTPAMAASQLRKLVEAHSVPFLDYMDPRYLVFNPNPEAKAVQSVMPGTRTSQLMPVPVGGVSHVMPDEVQTQEQIPEVVYDDVPVITGLPSDPPAGDINVKYEDLAAPTLHRLCEERGLPFKKNMKKAVLCELLRRQGNEVIPPETST